MNTLVLPPARRRYFCNLLLSATLSLWGGLGPFMGRAPAQTVGVEVTSAGPMDGFELYGRGIYWWNDGSIQQGELVPRRVGQIGIRSVIAGSGLVRFSSRPYFVVQSDQLQALHQGVARNDDFAFYFLGPRGNRRLYKRAIFGGSPALIDLSGVAYGETGALLLSGSQLYWAARGGPAATAGEVRVKDINGPPGGGDSTFKSGLGLVKKMRIVGLAEESGAVLRSYLLLLNTEGQLWHVRLPGAADPTTGPLTLYDTDIADFDTRVETESRVDPPFIRRISSTVIYAAKAYTRAQSRSSGKLVAYNFTRGGTSVEFDTGNQNLQVTSVAVDADRLYLTQTPMAFDAASQIVWRYEEGALFRKLLPANRDVSGSAFGLIAQPFEGRQLRTDTQWLYFAHRDEIRKIKTDAPDLQLDYRALGLEVYQSVQDFDHSVPLVAGKPAYARGYAQLLANTTGRKAFRLTGRITASRDGVPLPGEIDSFSQPSEIGSGGLAAVRTSLDRAFLFELPAAWIAQPGRLQLELSINADGTAPETGPTPFANNRTLATVTIAPARTPCLVFKPMSSVMGNYDPDSPGSGFGDIIDRATTLLPVTGFRVHFSRGAVRKPVYPFSAEPFFMPGDKEWALLWMTMAHAFSRDPDLCSDTHWVGTFPANIGTWNGIGGARGVSLRDLLPESPINLSFPRTALDNTSVVRMDPGNGNSSDAWSTVGGGHTLAHELGHNYGRFHINQTMSPTRCAGSFPDRPWHTLPAGLDPCALGITDLNHPAAPIGYDPRTGSLILPNLAADLMTYADSAWVTPFTWNALLGAIPAPSAPAGFAAASTGEPADDPLFTPALNPQPLPPGGIVLAQGLIHLASQTAALLPSLQLPNGILNDAIVQESLGAVGLPAGLPFSLRLLNPAGVVLDQRAVLPLAASESDNRHVAFVQAVPHVAGAARLQVLRGASVLAETRATPNPPQLSLGTPIVDAAAGTLALQWTATDPDPSSDPLLFTVQFSPDNGTRWDSLSILDPALSLTFDTRQWPGGINCRLRVIATDGFNSAVATSSAFSLPRQSPSVTILGLMPEQRVPSGAPIRLRAYAQDPDDGGLDPDSIQWTIAGLEPRTGRGSQFSLHGLRPGRHVVTATAADRDNQIGSNTLAFVVQPIAVPDGPEPTMDGLWDEAYAGATPVRLSPDRALPAAHFIHAGSALIVCFEGLTYPPPGGSPANINFYLDGDGVPTSIPQPGDAGFGVDENGVPARARGTGAGWSSEPPQGFEVKIFRGDVTWGAEFRIPETAINGWNRPSSLVIFGDRAPSGPLIWPLGADVFHPTNGAALALGPQAPEPNRAPLAVAAAPRVVSFANPIPVSLNGAGSFDPDTDPITFSWTQTDGPSVTIVDANSAAPWFVTPMLDRSVNVTFRLIVRDATLSSLPAFATVRLAPERPGTNGNIPSSPPASDSIHVDPGSGAATVRLRAPGPAGDPAVIQASSNLVTWVNLATNPVTALGSLLHADLNAGLFRQRFYRAATWAAPERPLTQTHLTFDGVDDVVVVPHQPILNALPITVTAWIRTMQTPPVEAGVIAKGNAGDSSSYGLGLHLGRLTYWYSVNPTRFVREDDAAGDMPFVADGQWHHVTLMVDGTGARLLLDGTEVRRSLWTGAPGPVTTAGSLRFGASPLVSNGFFAGDVDELTLWNRALTAAEANALFPGQTATNAPGLIGYWPGNEASGTSVRDATAQGFHGVASGGVQWSDSTAPLLPNLAAGTTLRFDGSDDVGQIPHQPTLNLFPLTVAAWVRTAQINGGYVAIASKYVPGSLNGYSVHIHRGRVAAFYFRDTSSFVYEQDPGIDGGFIADGQWHHVAYVVDGQGARLVVDGSLRGSRAWTGTSGACTTTAPLLFGRYPFAGQTISLDGRLDEITLWTRALNLTEINQLMGTKPAPNAFGLRAYWPLDEGSGNRLLDATGQGHGGTLQGGPIWLPSDAPFAP